MVQRVSIYYTQFVFIIQSLCLLWRNLYLLWTYLCYYLEFVFIWPYLCYYLEFVFILKWFACTCVYPIPLLFILDGPLDHSTFWPQVCIYSRQFVFIAPEFVFIPQSLYLFQWSLCLLFRVCIYYSKFLFIILEYLMCILAMVVFILPRVVCSLYLYCHKQWEIIIRNNKNTNVWI